MSEFGTDVTTPVGRVVWGSPTKPRPKTQRSGPTKGQPQLDSTGAQIKEISFGVAFPKGEFTASIWPVMAAEIATGYPSNVPPRFAYKFVDGDGVDPEGKLYSLREGYAGCMVLAYTQRINDTFGVPPLFKFNPTTSRYDILGPDDIKCGDYVAVGTNFKVHVASGSDDTPSVYVNPKGIELVGYGTAIVTAGAVDPNAIFGGQARALPAGASATPMQQPGAPSMPGMSAAPGGMPGAAPMPGAGPMPGAPPVAPSAPPPPPAPVAPARPTDPAHRHDNGNGTEQWFVNGAWDGGAHAVTIAPPPPVAPAHDFVAAAGYTPPAMPGMPGAAPGGMPGMPAPRS